MAITPLTGFKAFTFDGEKSTDYGVQILGEGVFNAPEREVEMINIPGRNGAFALDKGRFENIEVTYPANIIADSTADFAAAVSDLRNMLCSRRGYVRLQDDYHPDEYRMAVYKEGLEVDEKVLRAGEFDITFDCKPQRYLTSGEEAIDVSSGDTITNPTLFESSPMLEVVGGGTISFNGYNIELENAVYGDVEILSAGTGYINQKSITFNKNIANTGDEITISRLRYSANMRAGKPVTFYSETTSGSGFQYGYSISTDGLSAYIEITNVVLVVGTPSNIEYRVRFTQEPPATASMLISLSYDGEGNISADTGLGLLVNNSIGSWTSFILHSTRYFIEDTIFIDCDLGEAYKYEGGEAVSLNRYIDLGSDLPKLGPGSNEITFGNTVTDLKVTPKWWKV